MCLWCNIYNIYQNYNLVSIELYFSTILDQICIKIILGGKK